MSGAARLEVRIPERARRSQAERAAETRSRIIEAVVATIGEVGFQRATASEITRRAGVTWGAVQHHFGHKDGILAAVLEDSFGRFAERVSDIAVEAPVAERVGLFVDRAWLHFASPHYRSTFEILLSQAAADPEAEPAWRARMFRAWDASWARLFGDCGAPRQRTRTIQHYTLSVLSGLACMAMLEGSAPRFLEGELALLKETLAREFGA
jgi:AcrR family transcriptional regulator